MHSRVNHLFAAAVLSWGLLADLVLKFIQSPDGGRIIQTAFGFLVAGYTTLVARRAKGPAVPVPPPAPPAPPPQPPTIDLDALAARIAAALTRADAGRPSGCSRRIDDAARDHDPGVLRVYPDPDPL